MSSIRIITENNCIYFHEIPSVDMDEMLVTAEKTDAIGTSGLSSCFAICCRGMAKNGTPVLGLFHKTSLDGRFIDCFQEMKKEMIEYECVPESIETFVIGGVPTSPDIIGSEEEEAEILEHQEDANIKGCLFRYAQTEDEPLEVVLTPDSIFVSKHPISLFSPDPNQSEDLEG